MDRNPYDISSGTKSAIFCKQFKLNFFGSIWVIETQKFLSRDFFFKNAELMGGISFFRHCESKWHLK